MSRWILTVDFQSGFPLHGAGVVGRHALVVPAVAGGRGADHEGSVVGLGELRLLRVNLQSVLEPAHPGRRRACQRKEI